MGTMVQTHAVCRCGDDAFLHLFRVSASLDFMVFFFFNDTATTEIYTLSLHDALPIGQRRDRRHQQSGDRDCRDDLECPAPRSDRKSTRLNSSHLVISYAVFCLKK